MNVPKGHIYILIKNAYERPIYAKLAPWFKDRSMKQLEGAYNNFRIDDEIFELHTKRQQKNNTEVVDDDTLDSVKQSTSMAESDIHHQQNEYNEADNQNNDVDESKVEEPKNDEADTDKNELNF